MISISLCLIVKNEETTLGNCLESVRGIADEIVIVDTGSTDRTKEIARKYTKRIYDFVWMNDFAAARNYAFSLATKEYILWLDADDVFEEEDRSRFLSLKQTLDPSVDVVTMKYHYAFDEFGNVTLSFRRIRLVKRANQFKWHGSVHEYLEVSGEWVNSEITVTHRRIRPHSDRNLKIYEDVLNSGEPISIRDLYYYANELRDHGQYEKAILFYVAFLETKEGWSEDEIAALGNIADCYHNLGQYDKELSFTLKSFEYDTPRAEFCCRLGFFFLQKGEYRKAAFWYKLATELPRPQDGGFCREACWTWLPHLQLCICYYRLGDYEKSYFHNEMARGFRPEDPRILANKTLLDSEHRTDQK